jgi:hypothetical protein
MRHSLHHSRSATCLRNSGTAVNCARCPWRVGHITWKYNAQGCLSTWTENKLGVRHFSRSSRSGLPKQPTPFDSACATGDLIFIERDTRQEHGPPKSDFCKNYRVITTR